MDKAGKRVRIPEGSVLDLGGIAKGLLWIKLGATLRSTECSGPL